MMYKLKEINISDFRAFRQEKINFSNYDIVLLVGNNGMGKTSFFDAIEWGFTGSLKRYQPSSKEKQSEHFLSNKYARGQGNVNIILEESMTDKEVIIDRTTKSYRGNDFNQGNLIVNDEPGLKVADTLVKKNKSNINFVNSFNFSHFLSQELISDFIRNYKATDRYSVLSNLVGIQGYDQYSENFKLLKKICDENINKLDKKKEELEKEKIKLEESVKKTKLGEEELSKRYSKLLMEVKLLIEEGDQNKPLSNLLPESLEELEEKKDKKNLVKEKNSLEKKLNQQKDRFKKIQGLQQKKSEFKKNSELLKKLKSQKSDLKLIDKYNSKIEKSEYLLENYNPDINLEKTEETINDLKVENKKSQEIIDLINQNDLELINKVDLLIKEYTEVAKKFKKDFSDFSCINKKLKKLRTKIEYIETKINETQRIKQKLLSTAQEFIEDNRPDNCPVCQSEIDVDQLISQLTQRIDAQDAGVISDYREEKNRLKGDLQDLSSKKNELLSNLEQKIENLKQDLVSDLRKKKKKIQELKDDLKSQQKCYTYLEELEIDPANNDFKIHLESLIEKMRLEINNFKKENEINEIEEFRKDLFNQIKETEQQINSYKVQLDNLNIEDTSDLKEEYKVSQRKVNIYESRFENLKDILSELEDIFTLLENLENNKKLKDIKKRIKTKNKKLSLLNKQVTELKKLDQKVPEVINDMTAKILSPYKELANRIYQRINPQPIFNKIDWVRNSTSHNNGTLVLKMLSEEGLEVNPSYLYSSAQVNIVVLSLFFSFVIQNNWSKMNSVFLDDPIQNMDDINIFSFVDVIRSLFINNDNPIQLFISTHDRKLYSFLKKKFRNLNVLTLEFKNYDKEGPVILRK